MGEVIAKRKGDGVNVRGENLTHHKNPMTAQINNKPEGTQFEWNENPNAGSYIIGTSYDQYFSLGNPRFSRGGDGGAGYDIVEVEWGNSGSQDWEWKYNPLRDWYEFNFTLPGYSNEATHSFWLKNVEELRFRGETWFSPDLLADDDYGYEDDYSYEDDWSVDDGYGYEDDYSYEEELPSSNELDGNSENNVDISLGNIDSNDSSRGSSQSPVPVNVDDDLVINPRFLAGTKKKDKLNGSNFSDEVFGYGGADKINGKKGDDLIDAGSWTKGRFDKIKGGKGSDTFVIKDGYWSFIKDFKVVEDKLDLTGLSQGLDWEVNGRKTYIYGEDGYEVARLKGKIDLSSAEIV